MATPNPPFPGFYAPAIAPRPAQSPNGSTTTGTEKHVALFIDWDNLVISNYADSGNARPDLDLLIRKAQEYGTVVLARAYAEWAVTQDRLAVYNAGIDPAYAPVFHASTDLSGQTTRGKSLADPVMVTDCIDLLHTMPHINTYILVTGDKDMVPVVRLAKLRGRRVIIIGPDFVANVLQQVASEFYSYRTLQIQQFVSQYGYYPGYYPQPQGQPGQPSVPQPLPGFPGQTQQPGQPMLTPQAAFQPQQQPPQQQVVGQQQPQQAGAAQPQQLQPEQIQDQSQLGQRGGQRRLATTRGGRAQGYQQSAQPYTQVQVPQFNYDQPQQPIYTPFPQGYQQPAQPQVQYPQVAGAPTDVPTGTTGVNLPQPQQSAYVAPQVQQPQPYVAPQPPVPQSVYAAPQVQQPYVAPQPQAQPQQSAYVAPQVVAPAAVPQPAAIAPAPVAQPAPQVDMQQVREAVQWILATRAAANKLQVRARDLKEELLRRLPAFSERKLGFAKFKGLLNALEQAGAIQTEQVEHILWVSLPGAPSVAVTGLPEAVVEPDTDDDTDEEAQTTSATVAPAVVSATQIAALVTEAEDATPVAEPATTPAYPIHTPSVTGGIGEDAPMQTAVATPAAEVVAAPPGVAETAAPVQEAEARTTETPAVPRGPRPALLDTPFIEETIILTDQLRKRNRWLGYELLVAGTRDMLLPHMLESEAKITARDLVSRLLNEGIIRIELEKRSRGSARQTVKVCYLQEDNPVVRYVLNTDADAPLAEIAVAVDAVEAQPAETAAPEATQPDQQTEALTPAMTALPETAETIEAPSLAAALIDDATPDTVELAPPVAVASAEVMPQADTAPVAEVAPPAEPDYVTAFYTTARLVTPEELVAQPAPADTSVALAEATTPHVAVSDGLTPQTGDGAEGAPDHADDGGTPAPAGGYLDMGMTPGETEPVPVDGTAELLAANAQADTTLPDPVLGTPAADVEATGLATDVEVDPSDGVGTDDDVPGDDGVTDDAAVKPAPKRRTPYRRPRRPAARPEGDTGNGSGSTGPTMRLGYRFQPRDRRQHHSEEGQGETF